MIDLHITVIWRQFFNDLEGNFPLSPQFSYYKALLQDINPLQVPGFSLEPRFMYDLSLTKQNCPQIARDPL